MLKIFRYAGLWAVFVFLHRKTCVGYTKKTSSSWTRDYKILDVLSKEDCFGAAASMTGLEEKKKMELHHMGFSGCVFNIAADLLMYGLSDGITTETTPPFGSWQYLCDGVPTTTSTQTSTGTSTSRTSTSATSTTGPYSKLDGGAICADYRLPDVDSRDACFGIAMTSVGLGGVPTVELNFMDFSGCLFNAEANMVMYGVSPGNSRNKASQSWQYMCLGFPTTTTTATALTTSTAKAPYTKLSGGYRCFDHGLVDLDSEEACFAVVNAPGLGLDGAGTQRLDSVGFTGCIFNAEGNVVMFGATDGVTPQTTRTLPLWQYICTVAKDVPTQ